MKTLSTLALFALLLAARPALAQFDSTAYEQYHTAQMGKTIGRCATPIMQILTANPSAFIQTNKPDYKTNDVPYEFKTRERKLEGVLLCPVSGHVPFGSRDTTLMQRNAKKFAEHNETTLIVNGQKVASVRHNGAYVARLPFSVSLKPGKNTVVMQQRNLKSGETAYVGGFPMGRQFNIMCNAGAGQRATQNSRLRGCRVALGPRAGRGFGLKKWSPRARRAQPKVRWR